jgi:hypothetical protein
MMIQKGDCMRLLSVLLMLLATTTFAQVITLSNPMGAPGSTVNVDLSGPGNNIAAINFAVGYDPAVLSNPQLSLGALTQGCISDYNVIKDVSQNETGEFRGIIYHDPVQSFTDATGVIATISFKVAAGATPCTPTNLQLLKSTSEQFGISDTAGASTTGNYTTQDGSVRVTLPGDFNNNGAVTISDFTMLVEGWQTTYFLSDFTRLVENWQQTCSY